MLDFAKQDISKCDQLAIRSSTYLQSTSFPVLMSVMISRTQGGGVIGRRSCLQVSIRKYFGDRWQTMSKAEPYLVSKATHARTFGLLHNVKAVGEFSVSLDPKTAQLTELQVQNTYAYLQPFSTLE